MSFATIGLGHLEVGQWRPLSGDEIQRLREVADGVEPNKAGQKTRYKKGFARPKPTRNKPLSRKESKERPKIVIDIVQAMTQARIKDLMDILMRRNADVGVNSRPIVDKNQQSTRKGMVSLATWLMRQ